MSTAVQSKSAQAPAVGASRVGMVFLALVIGGAFGGFLVGTHEALQINLDRPAAPIESPAALAARAGVLPAPTYTQLRSIDRSPNRGWRSGLPTAAAAALVTLPPPERNDPAQVAAAVASRATRRAFAGAPPLIPHPIEARSTAACLTCHGDGLRLGDLVAPRVSHAHYAQCTQCHLAAAEADFIKDWPFESTFAGIREPGGGARAWPGAPPVIPHSTWMRSDCMSCHGTHGIQALRTSHPERSSCTQCHVPSAKLDQRETPARE